MTAARKARVLLGRAERAFRAKKCLRAGQLIDQVYRELGRLDALGVKTRVLERRQERLDERFERSCVRKAW